MLKIMNEVEDLLDGCALLEYSGNLYELAGFENGKYIFQNVNDDSHIRCTYESLWASREYEIQY